MNAKQRIKQLEKAQRAAKKTQADAVTSLQLRKVDYRAGIDPNIPDPPNAIPLRLIDLTETNSKDGDE